MNAATSDHRAVVHRSGRRAARRALSPPERARRRLLRQQLHLQRHPDQRHRPVRRARRPPLRRRPRQVFVATASSRPIGVEPPLLEDPVASGDFASDILIRGQNAVGGWSHIFGSALFSEFRFGYNRVRSDSVHPAFGIDANASTASSACPKDPRFYGGLPHMPIARFARIGGPFFRPQFQTSQVFQFAENLTWTKGTPHDEVRRRAAARPGALHRPAIAQRRAELPRRPLHRLRPRRLPARAVQRAAADALPRAGPLHRRLAGVRAGLVARPGQPDGELRLPLRVLHAAARSRQPADQHRSGDRRRSITAQDWQRLRAGADPAGSERLRAAGRRGLERDAASGLARRLRHLLPADRPLRLESQLGLNLPQLVDAAITANSGAERPRSPSPKASRRSTRAP